MRKRAVNEGLTLISFAETLRSLHYGEGIVMGKGLLAWWRRRIVTRGLAGVGLLAVPVAVAAMIGFGTSISGVAGGLSALTSGPDAVPASSQTGPRRLNRAVVALASKPTTTFPDAVSGGNGRASAPNISGAGGGSGGSGGSTGTSSTTGSGSAPTISPPSTPDVTLPGPGGSGGAQQTIDNVNGAVNNVLGGVNNTASG